MPSLSWHKIREWNGSQNEAFEELCCQLAHTEPVPDGSHFTRKGRPDSGLECFWTLPDGTEWGWQSKFFPDGLNQGRWKQCDKSFRRAVEGHPKLKRLHFCFPTSFPDDRKANRRTALNQWLQRRTDWLESAPSGLELALWDEHELMLRLTRQEHRGRTWFWFETPAFDLAWFRRHAKATVNSAETAERYSPRLHIDVPLNEDFAAFGRSPAFDDKLGQVGRQLNAAVVELCKFRLEERIGSQCAKLEQNLRRCIEAANSLKVHSSIHLPFERLENEGHKALEQVSVCREALWQLRQSDKDRTEHESAQARISQDHDFSRYTLNEVEEHLTTVIQFCQSREAHLANSRQMLIDGDAGFGKTHLLCHTLEHRIDCGEPTVLLLGERFSDAEPWTQIIQFLGLNCSRDELLGALDAAGEAAGRRTLLLIDALNEGVGISYWKKHLPPVVADLAHYKHVGLGISVRTAYTRQGMLPLNGFVRVEHPGFAGQATEASRSFFQKYGLEEPNVPLLVPEFDSPLFLKLTCEALKAAARTALPTELIGATAFFDFLLDSVNSRLASLLDYDVSEQRVHRAVRKLAAMMAENGSEYLALDAAKAALNEIHPATEHSKSLLQRLVSEHIIVRIPVQGGNSVHECVRFTYQRLSDHLIVESILSKNQRRQLSSLFEKDGTFGKWISGSVYSHFGWFQALAVQLPERFGRELDDFIPDALNDEVTRDAFFASLQWRTPKSISRSTVMRIERLIQTDYAFDSLNALIGITARPEHPLNADWLDRFLRPMNIVERDALWTVFLHEKLRKETPLKRLVEWARAERGPEAFDEEAVRLGCLTLAWCLAASDRFVRDRATKALVALLENRVELVQWLLDRFADVDEPYIRERLYAVAYGCAMRTTQAEPLKELAQSVYDKVFKAGQPPVSVLLRDYAKGVVEVALHKKLPINCERSRLIPPFRSRWPRTPPSLAALEKTYKGGITANYSGFNRVYRSVTGDDFKHYVIGDVLMWSDRRRSDRNRPPAEILERLRAALDDKNRELLDSYIKHCGKMTPDAVRYGYHDQEWLQQMATKYEEYFRAYLSPPLFRLFQKVIPWLKNPRDNRYRRVFSMELFQRLLLRRVLQLGFDERFSEFDSRVSESGRSPHKAERIGKKYQWIAHDELHARICDNFGLAEDTYDRTSSDEWRNGTWASSFRDIDPSLLVSETPHDGWAANQRNWWTPRHFDAWHSAPTKIAWLKSATDLPNPKDFLVLPHANEEWVALNAYANWERKDRVGSLSGDDRERQEVHYIFRSYLVKADHLAAMTTWGRQQNWLNETLPSPHHGHHIHLHEHYWSPNFADPLDDQWIRSSCRAERLPHPFVETTYEYLCEKSTYDCSMDKTVNIHLPSRWLATKMGLRVHGRRGDFVDEKGNLVTFDPSTREAGHGALLVRAANLREFLQRENLAVFWTLLGEKNIYPPDRQGWLGRLTVLGVYSWTGKDVAGDFRTEFK
jgi:hypothetical protein